VNRDQIDVQLDDRELIVTGEINETEQERRHRRARRYGRFDFRTVLPGEVNADQVSAQLDNGVLTITVPKAAVSRPRHIEITGGTSGTQQLADSGQPAAESATEKERQQQASTQTTSG
jgi:HSP20 family protein